MKKDKQLYMYALMPEEELRVKLEAERATFCELYNTKKALRLPIHITLIPPFEYYGDPNDLVKAVRPIADSHHPFDIVLDGYGSFQRNPVFYIHVKLSDELANFQKALKAHFQKSFPTILLRQFTDFSPHITLGYRDLTYHDLHRAIADYAGRNLTEEWHASNFLLWNHQNARWHTIQRIDLK